MRNVAKVSRRYSIERRRYFASVLVSSFFDDIFTLSIFFWYYLLLADNEKTHGDTSTRENSESCLLSWVRFPKCIDVLSSYTNIYAELWIHVVHIDSYSNMYIILYRIRRILRSISVERFADRNVHADRRYTKSLAIRVLRSILRRNLAGQRGKNEIPDRFNQILNATIHESSG